MMKSIWHDIRFGLRGMIKSPTVAVVAVLAMALGIGSTTAIFSIVNSVLTRPLPYKNPDRLMTIWETRAQPGQNQLRTSIPTFKDWQSQSQVFESMAAYGFNRYILTGVAEPEQIRGAQVSENFFAVMGVEPQLGRVFTPEQNAQPYALLSDSLWRRHFHADPSVIGKGMVLSGKNFTITGVMPRSFEYPGMESVLWTTLNNALSNTPEQATSRGFRGFRVVGRLKPDVTSAQAQSEMTLIASRLAQQYPDTNAGSSVSVIPLYEQVIGNVKPALYMLFGAVALLLLIAIANVANLLLTRALVREREFAVHQALGASRARLVQRMTIESLMLALVGGALGLLLAIAGIRLLVGFNIDLLPRLSEISVDIRALLFTLFVTMLSGIVLGVAPALQTKVNIHDVLKDSGRSSAGSARGRHLRGLLVISEVALSLVLLITATLMIRSFVGLLAINPNFNPNELLTMQTILPQSRYSSGEQIVNYYQHTLDGIRALPGVEAVGAGSGLPPVFNQSRNSFEIAGYQPKSGENMTANYVPISSDYFKALGTPLVQGVQFSEHDGPNTQKVVIINQQMAKRYFPDGRALGGRISFSEKEPDWRSIIGVVNDLNFSGSLFSEAEDAVYLPYTQSPYGGMFILVRTSGEPASRASDVRNAIRSVDQDVPVAKIRTMTQVLSESVAQPRFYMTMLSVFATIALVLAAIGIYGVISYSVAQRDHEIGVRMALGAQSDKIIRLVMLQGLKPVAIGVAIGLFAAFGITRVTATLLHGISPTDLTTFATVPLLLIGVAMLACFIPARRATRVDPVTVLRES